MFKRIFANDLVVVLVPSFAKVSNLPEKAEEEYAKEKELSLAISKQNKSTTDQTNEHVLSPSILKNSHPPSKSDEIHDIATQFALHIPDSMFSPIEIQGFLLKRKKEP